MSFSLFGLSQDASAVDLHGWLFLFNTNRKKETHENPSSGAPPEALLPSTGGRAQSRPRQPRAGLGPGDRPTPPGRRGGGVSPPLLSWIRPPPTATSLQV